MITMSRMITTNPYFPRNSSLPRSHKFEAFLSTFFDRGSEGAVHEEIFLDIL